MLKDMTAASDIKLREAVLAYYRTVKGELVPDNPGVIDIMRLNKDDKAPKDNEETASVSVYIVWTEPNGTPNQIQDDLDIGVLREFWRTNMASTPVHTTKTTKPTAPTAPTIQRTWFTDRDRIVKLQQPRISGVAGVAGGGVAWDARGSLRDHQGRMICVCTQQIQDKTKPCDHVMYAYHMGLDNQVLNLSATQPNKIRDFKVMIGLGMYIMPVRLTRAVDEEDPERKSKFIIVTSEVEVRLRTILKMEPDSRYVMTDDEGLFGYVRHVEDLIRETDVFKKLGTSSLVDNSTFMVTAGGCSRHHSPTVKKMIMTALVASNPMREAWMIGNVASLNDQGSQCLGCRRLAVGENDVPKF